MTICQRNTDSKHFFFADDTFITFDVYRISSTMLDDNIDQRCLPGGCYMNTQVDPTDVEVEEEPDDWFSRNKLFVFIGCLIFIRWLWGYMGW